MAFTEPELREVHRKLESFLERRRPPEDLRDEVDLGFRIEDQSIVVFEVRAAWRQPGSKIERPIAKTTFVRSRSRWKIYWMRSDGRWHLYRPDREVSTLAAFLRIVERDEYGCFWG